MITKMTGRLNRVLDEEVRMEVGPFEYQVLVPEAVRRNIQLKTGEEMSLHISEYLEGGPNGNKFIPRRIGFLHEEELEFFDLFCTVDKIGVKKALKALARPIQEIANAISREDAKWLTTLPGIGATTAEQIVTTLKRKVTKFAVAGELIASTGEKRDPAKSAILDELYQAMMSLGQSPIDARNMIDQLIRSKKNYSNVEEAMTLVYSNK
jgi:holliday junction DNA helicase RuvA